MSNENTMDKTDGRTNQAGTAGIMRAIKGYIQDGGKKRRRSNRKRRSSGKGISGSMKTADNKGLF